jgi:hypothetical protein
MGNPVMHWEINAKDGKKLQVLRNLFDWKIETTA